MSKANHSGPEVPPGFNEACAKYEGWDNETAYIWSLLKEWRSGKGPHSIEFEKRILEAVKTGDLDYVQKLTKAMRSKGPPNTGMNAYLAAVEAFEEIFFDGSERSTREEWPTKQEVRERATEILKAAGHPPVSDRHWPRVFKAAGLSELPAGGLNRPI